MSLRRLGHLEGAKMLQTKKGAAEVSRGEGEREKEKTELFFFQSCAALQRLHFGTTCSKTFTTQFVFLALHRIAIF